MAMQTLDKKLCLASLPRTVRGKPIVMHSSPDKKTILYQNGKTVFIRNVEDPSQCDTYTQHSHPVTVAKYSPSGFYIASGDVSGKIRIWDTVNLEHILKYEYHVLGGEVKDMEWTEDSKRIVVVGDGREKYGAAIMWDTGTSVGTITGHSKPINSVAVRQQRPYRVVTASEDYHVAFYEGPPFKLVNKVKNHSNFVNVVRYAPDGEMFVSGGADGMAFVHEGKTGEMLYQLGAGGKAHGAGIYSMAFGPMGQLMTVSADKSCKVWNLESKEQVGEFALGEQGLMDMQVGCVWPGEQPITVSLSGYINYLDSTSPSDPKRIIMGHNKNIVSFAMRPDGNEVFTGDMEGRICSWNIKTGTSEVIKGKGHTNLVQDLRVHGEHLISISVDDTIMCTNINTMEYGSDRLKLESQPRGIAVGQDGLQIVACLNEVVVLRNMKIVYTEKINYEAECVDIHPDQKVVVVGGTDDSSIHLYDMVGDSLSHKKKISRIGSITSVKFSPNREQLVVTDGAKKIIVYNFPSMTEVVSEMWSRHKAKITCCDWSPNSKRIVTGALDTDLVVYTLKSNKFIDGRAAHPMGSITKVLWLDDSTVVSVAFDSCIRVWSVPETK